MAAQTDLSAGRCRCRPRRRQATPRAEMPVGMRAFLTGATR
jgi:hypothetical protein